MTTPLAADVALVTPAENDRSYVDWPAILAGVVMASALSILLLTFGSAVGLSFTNFSARQGADPIWIAIAAASWLLWVEVSSFMAGAYLTGRLRRRAGDGATEHEVDVRDGAHGLLVWAGALVLGAVLAAGGVGAVANAVGSAAATLTTAASNVAGGAAEGALDPNAYFVDTLFRPAPGGEAAAPAVNTTATPAAPATDTAATPAVTPPAASATATEVPATTEAQRAEVGRIFAANTVSGQFNADDRSYLAQLVASQTGMPQADAEARVDQVIASVEKARADAAAAAETARRTAVIAGFLIAASFLVSAIGAYWAAHKGGQHRDQATPFHDVFRRW